MHAEDDFRAWALAQGWTTTKRGWPDFLCRRVGIVMAVEVKDGQDGLRSEQVQALSDLNSAGIPTFVWTRETGLRPYPGPVPLASDPALMQRILELEVAVAQACADRDAALALVAEKVAENRRLQARSRPSPGPGKDRSPEDVESRRREKLARKEMRLAEVAEKRTASRARAALRIANFEMDGTEILLRRDTRIAG